MEDSPDPTNEEDYHEVVKFQPQRKKSQDLDGCHAWFVTFMAFLIFVLSGGVFFTGGIIIPELLVSFPDADEASASLVVSMASGMMNVAALFSGCFSEVFGWRKVCLAGGFMTFLGLFTSAFVNSIGALYFTYGTLTGLGLGIQFLPCIVIVQRYFTKRHAFATSILYSGSSVGVFLFAIIIRHLIDMYAWRGALLIMSAIIMHGIPFAMVLKPPAIPKSIPHDYDADEGTSYASILVTSIKTLLRRLAEVGMTLLKSFKDLADPKFAITLLANFLKAVEYGIPYVMLPMKLLLLGYSKWQVAILVAVMGAGDFVGRLLVGIQSITCNFNRILFFASSLLLSGLTEVLVGLISDYYGLCICAFCLAVNAGVYISSIAPILHELVGEERVPRSYGLVCSTHAVAGIVGLPLHALIYEVTGNINIAFFVSGSFPTMAFFIILVVYFLQGS